MGEPETPHFYDFGISGRVPGSQNQLFLFLETPGYLTKSRKPLEAFPINMFVNRKVSELHLSDNVRKGGRRK